MKDNPKERKFRTTELTPAKARYSGWWPWGVLRYSPSFAQREMEEFFDDPWSRELVLWPGRPVRTRVPVVDIREEEDRYIVEADLPGMSREDVCIEVGGRRLDITATKRKVEEETGEGYIRRERGLVTYCRSLDLPEDAKEEGIEAKLEEGVLRLVIPREERVSKRKLVEVQ